MRAPLLALLLCGSALVALAQDPEPGPVRQGGGTPAGDVGPPVRPRDIYGRPNAGPGGNLELSLQGCWKLVQVESDRRDFGGATLNGYLLAHRGFLVFEMQAYFGGNRQRFDEYQTFFTEYRMEDSGLLTLTTLSGSWLEADGATLTWEEVGHTRRMTVEFPSPNTLVLSPDTGGRMSFVRRPATHRRSQDFWGVADREGQGASEVFGRRSDPFEGPGAKPVGDDGPANSADPSGRGPVGDDVARDIFGRPIRTPDPASGKTPPDGAPPADGGR